jgi:hypothetical protein
LAIRAQDHFLSAIEIASPARVASVRAAREFAPGANAGGVFHAAFTLCCLYTFLSTPFHSPGVFFCARDFFVHEFQPSRARFITHSVAFVTASKML